jgi:hypothetical protein
MTKDEALKLAIEVNEWLKIKLWIDSCAADELDKVTNACKEALEQPAWQGLTDDEISDIYCHTPARPISNGDVELMFDFAKAIEQALKDKNT